MRDVLRTLGVFVAVCCCLAATASATTLQPLTGEELTDTAETIVVGRCSAVESQWFGRSLMTLVTVTVDESWKGEAASELTVVIPGGVDNDRPIPVAVTYPGAPVITPGEDILLFLTPSVGIEGHSIVGFSQGVFPIIKDEGAKAQVVQTRKHRQGALDLDEVRSRIQSYLEAAKP